MEHSTVVADGAIIHTIKGKAVAMDESFLQDRTIIHTIKLKEVVMDESLGQEGKGVVMGESFGQEGKGVVMGEDEVYVKQNKKSILYKIINFIYKRLNNHHETF